MRLFSALGAPSTAGAAEPAGPLDVPEGGDASAPVAAQAAPLPPPPPPPAPREPLIPLRRIADPAGSLVRRRKCLIGVSNRAKFLQGQIGDPGGGPSGDARQSQTAPKRLSTANRAASDVTIHHSDDDGGKRISRSSSAERLCTARFTDTEMRAIRDRLARDVQDLDSMYFWKGITSEVDPRRVQHTDGPMKKYDPRRDEEPRVPRRKDKLQAVDKSVIEQANARLHGTPFLSSVIPERFKGVKGAPSNLEEYISQRFERSVSVTPRSRLPSLAAAKTSRRTSNPYAPLPNTAGYLDEKLRFAREKTLPDDRERQQLQHSRVAHRQAVFGAAHADNWRWRHVKRIAEQKVL